MATQVLSTIISTVTNSLWAPVERQFVYVIEYRKNVAKLNSQVETLVKKRTDVGNLVKQASDALDVVDEEVEGWRKRASETELAAKKLQSEAKEGNWWIKGCCLDWNARYKVGKEAAKLGVTIEGVLKDGNFTKVSHPRLSPVVIPTHVDCVEGLKTVEGEKDLLMSTLSNNKFAIIGVYGKAGIGKTVMMKRLNNELQSTQLFKKVVMVTISSNPDIQKIQDEIAQRLGMMFDAGKSSFGRVHDLYTRLQQEETVLIILDDVWKPLDLSEIGIPNRNDHKGCKILLSTRFEKVCIEMETRPTIEMEPLNTEESWILFKKTAGEIVESPTVKPVADLLIKECKGLPSAIVTFGKSLRNEANRLLSNDALSALRNYPKDTEVNSFFVLCSLFPGATFSLKLFLYGIEKGFLKVDGTLLTEINKCFDLIQKLNAPCLSMVGRGEDYLKIQDVVRDVAILISKKVISKHAKQL